MKAITAYILLLSLAFICSQSEEEYIGGTCEDKSIAATMDEAGGAAGDYNLANHKVASCASLYPYDDTDVDNVPKICCYTKIKYKLEDEKYTRKGCESIYLNENIDSQISTFEQNFATMVNSYYSSLGTSVELKDIEADIDCKSKFLKYSVLLFLIVLF